jgi:hypothetical protein
MRPTIWIAASAAALAIAGCGDQHQRRAESNAIETPASSDAIAADRTRDRDVEPPGPGTVTPGSADVQAAYEQQRAEERASGRIGTAGEAARAGQPATTAAGPTPGSFGGSSAGSEAPRGGTMGSPGIATDNPAGGDRPIPYAGSRTIEPYPYPEVPTEVAPSEVGRTPTTPARTPTRPENPGTFGIPAHPESGSRAMSQSNAGSTIQGPEGPATAPSTQHSGY